ncbi:MAG: ZIP family metal transporter [Tissierellia bacterium]|nr:ZIP family metal transporter [Tissierellia bacterium]
MDLNTIIGLLIPFAGTTLGAACVYLMKENLKDRTQKTLAGFAAGVMVAASIWSLILPAMEMVEDKMGKMAWVPSAVGFMVGVGFLLLLDNIIPHLHADSDTPEGPRSKLQRTTMLVLAVTLHNIPEGMAVGVTFAGFLSGDTTITLAGAMVLSLGIAIQNFPEGAIISMPLRAEGVSAHKSFVYGTLSGIVEPIAGVITILLSHIMISILPYLLTFAAGAMMYVVVEELIPEASEEGESHTNLPTIGFSFGFIIMMILDVALG